jgi:hypothetical protein
MNRGPAPLYVDTFDLCLWLIKQFGSNTEILPHRICCCSLDLLQAVTLALKGRRRDEHLEIADEQLITLRAQIRLANACDYLKDPQMLYVLERVDAIGRQLGGWIKSLEPA